MSRITTTALRARPSGPARWLTDGGSSGTGRLAARVARNNVHLYFQYYEGANRKRLPLGPYDESGERGLSLVEARDRSAVLSTLYRNGVKDLHSHVESQLEDEADARKAAELAVAIAAEEAKRGTLKQLLSAYVKHLEQAGKMSAKDVRSIFDKHVFKASAELGGRK